jgi:hypothetical protein
VIVIGFLKTAQGRLETLYEQKALIEKEIEALKIGTRFFAGFAREPGQWINPGIGITEAITELFKSNPTRCFTAPLIRDELLKRGIPLKQKNPLATIHQVIARLIERKGGGLVEVISDGGRSFFVWKKGMDTLREEGLKATQKTGELSKTREATPKVASRKGQVKTDDAASTKTS